jgi:hypothetical protein
MQLVPITTIVSSNLDQGEVYNVVFSGSTNKAEIWLKVALSTIKQTNINLWRFWLSCFKDVGFLAPKEFSIIFGFPIFKLCDCLMEVILETRRVH